MAWQLQAACLYEDPEIFFRPEGMGRVPADYAAWLEGEARAVCKSCPVQAECLADAVETDDRHAIRGAHTYEERLALGLQTRPFEHGGVAGYRSHERRGEPPCDACREGRNRHRRERERNGRRVRT